MLIPAYFALVLAAAPAAPAQAEPAAPGQGGLMVAPTRLVFEGRRRSAELTLLNNSSTATTYRVGFVEMRLTETGGIEEIPEAATSAAPLLRYSPRQVRLEPRAPQVVRLQLRKPAELPSGEYRSHLVFRIVPETAPSAGSDESREVSVKLVAVYGVAIPVIVRHGETAATASFAELALRNDAEGPLLDFKINRNGNRSVYGDLTATFTPVGGKPAVVGVVNGVAVYVQNAVRRVQLRLRPPPGVSLRAGRLRLAYTGAENPEGPRPLLAIAELSLP